ncbi:hypothetical protein AB0I49_13695 [Streptomyces sp. NPDC050617]|uniref:hypothetical protein n=1 Tax=Streptomyces sp. NPDC050617 TaxID=3154628 RepID=UPI00341FF0B0
MTQSPAAAGAPGTAGREAGTAASSHGAPASAAHRAAGICQLRKNVSHTDFTGKTFTSDLYCENVVADVYAKAENYATVVGKLVTTLSWFVCWETGELHAGKNRIWYYTQGDRILNWPQRKGWGYVPAYRLTTTVDPFPGLPACVPGVTSPGLNQAAGGGR